MTIRQQILDKDLHFTDMKGIDIIPSKIPKDFEKNIKDCIGDCLCFGKKAKPNKDTTETNNFYLKGF